MSAPNIFFSGDLSSVVDNISRSMENDSIDFVFVGNGECFDYKLPNKSIFYKPKRILIDAGYNIFPWLLYLYEEHNIDLFPEIILITHRHVDHFGSLECFCHYYEFVLHRKLKIFSNIFDNVGLSGLLEINKLSDVSYNSVCRYSNVSRFHVDCLLDCLNNQDNSSGDILYYYPHGGHLVCDSYGFVVGDKNKCIVYTGDSRYLKIHEKIYNKVKEISNKVYFVHDYVMVPNIVHASDGDIALYNIPRKDIVLFSKEYVLIGDGL